MRKGPPRGVNMCKDGYRKKSGRAHLNSRESPLKKLYTELKALVGCSKVFGWETLKRHGGGNEGRLVGG